MPPPRRGAPPGAAGVPDVPMAAVPTIAERMARMRAQEAEQKAKAAAAELAERAEIGRLMETLTPQQVIHLLGEMQRLALRAPEVARALIAENMQLALALQHAEFLAGMIEESPLPTEPEVKERARNVREKLWGSSQAPAPPHPSAVAVACQGSYPQGGMPLGMLSQPGLMALPGMPPHPMTMALLPFGGTAYPPPPPPPNPGYAPAAAAAATPVAGALPQFLMSASSDEASRQGLMEQLVKLSPAEIDRLPHDQKVQLLQFLQNAPPRS